MVGVMCSMSSYSTPIKVTEGMMEVKVPGIGLGFDAFDNCFLSRKSCILKLAMGNRERLPSIESIIPVILAAGDSTRMGYPKALLPLGDRTFLTHILEVLKNAGLPQPVIVLGKAAPEISPVVREYDASILINKEPERGQLSSIQLALRSLPSTCSAGMIWPVDQPSISENLVLDLSRLFLASRALITLPANGGRRGHPAIFHRTLFQEFLDIPVQEGPKRLLVHHRNETTVLDTEESGCLKDIDTPSDYLQLTGEKLEHLLENSGRPG
jgi:molybdenum cofactor cytidylyltransferase